MGRGVLSISEPFITSLLSNGWQGGRLRTPIHGARIEEVRFSHAHQTVDMLLEAPSLKGSPLSGWLDAERIDTTVEREFTPPAHVTAHVVVGLLENAEGHCTCHSMGVAGYYCAVCRSKDLLALLPGPVIDQAKRDRVMSDAVLEAAKSTRRAYSAPGPTPPAGEVQP